MRIQFLLFAMANLGIEMLLDQPQARVAQAFRATL
jgi:hypothetical protein